MKFSITSDLPQQKELPSWHEFAFKQMSYSASVYNAMTTGPTPSAQEDNAPWNFNQKLQDSH